jgi:hypothetical protein
MTLTFTKFKKGIALVAVFLMLFTIIPMNANAIETASDISGHWAEETIQEWIDNDWVKGYPDGSFKPDDHITRAEFVALVNRSFQFTTTGPISFTDVNQNAWYASAIGIAVRAGYIQGYNDNTMRPENHISREEAATIIMKINNLTANSTAANVFTDSALLTWSKGAVGAVAAANLMTGYPDGTFGPTRMIRRGETVVLLDRSVKYIDEMDAPAAPLVTRDDVTNTVTGMTSAMEYKLDNGVWTSYVASVFNALNLSGNHTLLVRYEAIGILPAGLITTLTFTTASTGGGGGDTTAPTFTSVSIDGTVVQGTIEYSTTTFGAVTVAMSESVSFVTGNVGEVTIDGAVFGTFTISPNTRTLTITPTNSNGFNYVPGTFTFVIAAGTLRDASGNQNATLSFTLTFVADTTPPTYTTVSIDGIVVSGTVTYSTPTFTTLTVAMSEAVTLVVGEDAIVTIDEVEFGTFTISADGMTLIITPTNSNGFSYVPGTFLFEIAEGTLQDGLGNKNADLSFELTFETDNLFQAIASGGFENTASLNEAIGLMWSLAYSNGTFDASKVTQAYVEVMNSAVPGGPWSVQAVAVPVELIIPTSKTFSSAQITHDLGGTPIDTNAVRIEANFGNKLIAWMNTNMAYGWNDTDNEVVYTYIVTWTDTSTTSYPIIFIDADLGI